MSVLDYLNKYREENGYYSIEELCDVIGLSNIVVDPYSLLISKNVIIGAGNLFSCGVTISSDTSSRIIIGNKNSFANNTHIEAANNTEIRIDNNVVFNDGCICVKCNIKGGKMKFGNNGRFDGRINIFGNCDFGVGSQIIGTINVYGCTLQGGGDFTEPDPDKRAGLIKGIGTARNITVETGNVLNGFGDFDPSKTEPQSVYHKKS